MTGAEAGGTQTGAGAVQAGPIFRLRYGRGRWRKQGRQGGANPKEMVTPACAEANGSRSTINAARNSFRIIDASSRSSDLFFQGTELSLGVQRGKGIGRSGGRRSGIKMSPAFPANRLQASPTSRTMPDDQDQDTRSIFSHFGVGNRVALRLEVVA